MRRWHRRTIYNILLNNCRWFDKWNDSLHYSKGLGVWRRCCSADKEKAQSRLCKWRVFLCFIIAPDVNQWRSKEGSWGLLALGGT